MCLDRNLNKIALGTALFGIKYDIDNKSDGVNQKSFGGYTQVRLDVGL
tara:strand:- start:639 stop:782 length:144 start_codon:yes stop_codon:yes gene_type:complete